ncbi:hypothetical protein OIU84_025166 [Salix udensis]|uniref:Uncharacterized protein n=1 Tax=Salix udensis TaxID=889485 RepID=A0AAD6KIX4_9ROSI|nr:hypothetical protein OIU84_025166 [Salix udensis]
MIYCLPSLFRGGYIVE